MMNELTFDIIIVSNHSSEFEAFHALTKQPYSCETFKLNFILISQIEDVVNALIDTTNVQAVIVSSALMPADESSQNKTLKNYLNRHEQPFTFLQVLSVISDIRPELNVFLYKTPIDSTKTNVMNRLLGMVDCVFSTTDSDYICSKIVQKLKQRYKAPFFDAVLSNSKAPSDSFHALPISKGKSVEKSKWIQDLAQLLNSRVLAGESSATNNGLDSLLMPTGSIKNAQKMIAKAFGANESFFVTNGTSTSNKIVMQAVVRPDDIVLISKDCHKSFYYSLTHVGAHAVILETYPIDDYHMYGGVRQDTIINTLNTLKEDGLLEKVKAMVITNTTFDGILHNPFDIMMRVLAIKPDIVFIWDEAWFSYGYLSPYFRNRCAMQAAEEIKTLIHSQKYIQDYAALTATEKDGLPDPSIARLRVYASQSMHKSLTAMRQGSLIHVHDEDFAVHSDEFHTSYNMHTSTSPSYLILASMDIGRRQAQFEGYGLIKEALENAFLIRKLLTEDPLIAQYIKVLSQEEFTLDNKNPMGRYHEKILKREDYEKEEFVLNPLHINIDICKLKISGDELKKILMMDYSIQINKTSFTSILIIVNIGVTQNSIANLVNALRNIIKEQSKNLNKHPQISFPEKLPRSSIFPGLKFDNDKPYISNIREAYYESLDAQNVMYHALDETLLEKVQNRHRIISAGYVTPYPPGFPVLLPGQEITVDILDYLLKLNSQELHGINERYEIKVFKYQIQESPAYFITNTVAQIQ